VGVDHGDALLLGRAQAACDRGRLHRREHDRVDVLVDQARHARSHLRRVAAGIDANDLPTERLSRLLDGVVCELDDLGRIHRAHDPDGLLLEGGLLGRPCVGRPCVGRLRLGRRRAIGAFFVVTAAGGEQEDGE
jgi:hypothetical protein